MDTLVFVHGYLGGSAQWAGQVAIFSEHFRVITPDLPGFGLNSSLEAPETIQGFATYVLGDLDKKGIDRFHLVGHSMGGMIVQEMVALASEKVAKLVLYGTGPVGSLPGRFETLNDSKRKLTEEGVARTGRRIAATWFLKGDVAVGYKTCADLAGKARLQAAIAGLSAMETWSGVASLSKISCRTLILWGDHDRAYHWSQPEQLWREIDDAWLAVIPGCSHAVHLEKPHIFNATLLDFLMSDNS